MTDPVLFYSASAALACVLLLGALDKFRDLPGFAAAVSAYEILPAGIGAPFALLLALAEVAAGALLLTPAWQPAGAGLALLVLATATAGLAFNLARGRRDMDCGCAGPMSRRPGARGTGLSWWLVARNAALAAWTAPVLAAGVAGLSRGLLWTDAASVFGLAASAVALYFTANHLLASHLKLQAI